VAWLADEGDRQQSSCSASAAATRTKVVDALPTQLKLLIKALCGEGADRRRDGKAIVRLWLRLGCRAGELLGMQFSYIDLQQGGQLLRPTRAARAALCIWGRRPPRGSTANVRARRTHPV